MVVPQAVPAHAHDARRASLTLLVSATLFAVMALAARVVSVRISGPQIALLRFASGLVVVLVAVLIGRAVIKPRRWGWLLARGLFGGVAVFSYFSCIEHAGVGIATLLNYTAPVWSLLLSWWLLHERPRPQAVIALAVTLCGVVLVVGGRVAGLHAGFWEGVGVFSAVCSGLAVTSIRAVRRRAADGLSAENSWTVFGSFTTLGIVATLPGVVGPFGHWVAPTGTEWALLLIVAATSIVAQMLMTDALEHVTAANMGIIHQLTVVIAMVCGVLIFGEHITAASLAGSVITVAGVVWTTLAPTRPS